MLSTGKCWPELPSHRNRDIGGRELAACLILTFAQIRITCGASATADFHIRLAGSRGLEPAVGGELDLFLAVTSDPGVVVQCAVIDSLL